MCVKVAVERGREHPHPEVLGHACEACCSQSALTGRLPALQINSARAVKMNDLL